MSASSNATEAAEQNGERRYGPGRHRDSHSASPFVPLLILAVAILVWSGFQTVMLAREAVTLSATRENQDTQIRNAQKLRDALDAVARDTARLAGKGNPNARLIVDELRKRGVTINPDAPPPAKNQRSESRQQGDRVAALLAVR